MAFRSAFAVIADLREDITSDPQLRAAITNLEPGSEAQKAFVRDLAFERALRFRRRFDEASKNMPRIVLT